MSIRGAGPKFGLFTTARNTSVRTLIAMNANAGSAKPETRSPKRPLKSMEQKIKCQYCPRSFSTPRWNTNHCNQEHLDLIKVGVLINTIKLVVVYSIYISVKLPIDLSNYFQALFVYFHSFQVPYIPDVKFCNFHICQLVMYSIKFFWYSCSLPGSSASSARCTCPQKGIFSTMSSTFTRPPKLRASR